MRSSWADLWVETSVLILGWREEFFQPELLRVCCEQDLTVSPSQLLS